jgi:hypothetical protein
MEQLTIEHKNTIKTDRRFWKGMIVAVSCEIVAIDDDDDHQQKRTYKVQSETDVNKYYIVKFIAGTPVYCSCKDFEIQTKKGKERHICKHQRGIILAENYGLIVVEVTKQQQNSKSQNIERSHSTTTFSSNIKKQESTSYKDDDYSF